MRQKTPESCSNGGSRRKRPRSSSPKLEETPRKLVKSCSSEKRSKEPQDSCASSSDLISKSPLNQSSFSSKLDKEDERLSPDFSTKNSRSEVVESSKVSRKRKKKGAKGKEQTSALSSSDTEAGYKNQPKKKRERGGGKGKSRVKQRGKLGRKVAYHSALLKIAMASPG